MENELELVIVLFSGLVRCAHYLFRIRNSVPDSGYTGGRPFGLAVVPPPTANGRAKIQSLILVR